QELGGVDGLDGGGRDIELHLVEGDRGKKSSPLSVGHVGGFGVRVVIVCHAPVGGRDVGDGIDTLANIGPICGAVFGLGKQTADADDCQRNPAGGNGPIQFFLFHERYSLICVSSSGSVCRASPGRLTPW